MSGLTIGKGTYDNPDSFEISGDRKVRMHGELGAATLPAAKAQRALLLATIRQGGVEPVTWSEDPSVDGYYRITGGSVKNVDMSLAAAPFTFEFDIEAERLPHYQALRCYVRTDGRERAGMPGGTTEDYWLGLPTTVIGKNYAGSSLIPYDRQGPGGHCWFAVDPGFAAGLSSCRVEPAHFYDMSPLFKVDSEHVVGDEVLQPATVDLWTLDNGLVKVSGSTSHTFAIQFPKGSAPGAIGTTYNLDLGLFLSSTLVVLTADKVIHPAGESADTNRVDLTGFVSTPASTDEYEVAISIILRRGSHHVEIQSRSDVSAVHVLHTGIAMTAVTAGQTSRADADDADTNRLIVASGAGWTTFTGGTGRHRSASTTVQDWMVGVELAGAAAVAPNTAGEEWDFYWADMSSLVGIAK